MSVDMQPTPDPFVALGDDVCCRILKYLSVQDVAAMGVVDKHWAKILKKEGLWRTLVERDYSTQQHSVNIRVCHKAWAAIYRACHALATFKYVRWVRQRGRPNTFKCTPREGHTLVAWGQQQVVGLCFGGFSQTPNKQYVIHNDVHMLLPGLPGRSPQWQPVQTIGTPPAPCYGHSMTTCGPGHIYALVFGGMTDSGYFGETNVVSVLTEPRHVASLPGAPPLPPKVQPDANAPLVWATVDSKGIDEVVGRGYHAAAASPDGMRVYIFGGISRRQSRNDVAVLNVATWTWEVLETHGEAPAPRFGASAVVVDNHLWVVGGGWGYDLLRSGGDHDDVFCLDLSTNEWRRPPLLLECPYSASVGRCHAAALVGDKLLFFGGSLEMSNSLCWLDIRTQRWGAPNVVGPRPQGRLSATLTVLGQRVFMFGGWMPGCHELGDLHEVCCFETHDACLEWEHAGAQKWLVEQVESHHDCDLPTCPCHKLLRRRAQAAEEAAAEAELTPASGSLYRLGSSRGGTTDDSPASGSLYRSGSSHVESPGNSVKGGALYRSGTGGAATTVRAVVTPGGALYRTGSNAPPVAAVRSTTSAAQAIGVVGGAAGGDTRSRLARGPVRGAAAQVEAAIPVPAQDHPQPSSAAQGVLSPFQQVEGAGPAPPLPRAAVEGARQASLPMGVEGWSQRADEAEALAHRLLDALRPSDSELQEAATLEGPAPLRPLWNTRSTSAMPTRPALWATWSPSHRSTPTPQSRSLGSQPSSLPSKATFQTLPSDATSLGVDESAFSAPGVHAPDLSSKGTSQLPRLHSVPEQADGASAEQSEGSAALAALLAAPHRETYSAPEMERELAALGSTGVLTAATRRLLRQRTVSLPAGTVREQDEGAALPLPNRSPSLNTRQSRGVRAWLTSVLRPAEDGVQAVVPQHSTLWRSKS